MKIIFSILISLLCIFNYTQTIITGKVIDKNTGLPIEGVEITTSDSNKNFTNSEGKYYLYYTGGVINFNHLYYQDKEISDIKDHTTISLTPLEMTDIDEIVVKSPKLIVEEAFKEMKNNYVLFPYSESFFLRGTIKQNNELLRIVDLTGQIHRKTSFLTSTIKENKYKASVSNIRKAGKVFSSNKIEYVNLFTLKEILYQATLIGIEYKNYNFYKGENIDSLYTKIYFTAKENINNPREGFYIINNTDNAILSVYYHSKNDRNSELPFTSKYGFKWRTMNYNIAVSYSYNSSLKKYTQSNCVYKYNVELFDRNNKRTVYDLDYQLLLSNPTTSDISSNTSVTKEIFKIEGAYNEEFWKKQNQLLLTEEMKKFINSLQDNKEYKAILSK